MTFCLVPFRKTQTLIRHCICNPNLELFYCRIQKLCLNLHKTIVMITVDRNKCPHDHICPLINICPEGAITQGVDGYPIIDYSLCIECGLCIRKCPMRAIKQI